MALKYRFLRKEACALSAAIAFESKRREAAVGETPRSRARDDQNTFRSCFLCGKTVWLSVRRSCAASRSVFSPRPRDGDDSATPRPLRCRRADHRHAANDLWLL